MNLKTFNTATEFFLLYKTLFLQMKEGNEIIGDSFCILNPRKRIVEDATIRFNIKKAFIEFLQTITNKEIDRSLFKENIRELSIINIKKLSNIKDYVNININNNGVESLLFLKTDNKLNLIVNCSIKSFEDEIYDQFIFTLFLEMLCNKFNLEMGFYKVNLGKMVNNLTLRIDTNLIPNEYNQISTSYSFPIKKIKSNKPDFWDLIVQKNIPIELFFDNFN